MDALTITNDQLTLGRVLVHDQHGVRCMQVATALARALGITDEDAVNDLRAGSWLHDIGKAWVLHWIVDKAGPLEPEEREAMQQHPVLGAEFLSRIGVNGGVRAIVLHHHEKWNGKGYPRHLAGQKIPMLARIIAPIDTYDALRQHRNYPRYDAEGKPLQDGGEFDHDAAMRIIEYSSGVHFDPRVIRAFIRLKDREFR